MTVHRSMVVAAALAVVSLTASAAGAQQPEAFTLKVHPRIVPPEEGASVRLRIEPDARSRSVELEWWSEHGTGGSHLITLEGGRAAIHHEFPIRRLDEGEYEITAVLTRDDGSRVRRKTTLVVSGGRLP